MADQSQAQMLSLVQNAVTNLGSIQKALISVFPAISGTSASAVAGSATLPAAPVGFITVKLPNGTSVKVPYYS